VTQAFPQYFISPNFPILVTFHLEFLSSVFTAFFKDFKSCIFREKTNQSECKNRAFSIGILGANGTLHMLV